MIDEWGWFDWMARDYGPADKVYSQRNTALLYLPHSAEGRYAGWMGRLKSTARLPDGRYTPYAAASVTGWIFTNGQAIQHYPIFASCWASGARYPNTNGVAFENEGFAGTQLTPPQVATNARIIRDLADFHAVRGLKWAPTRPASAQDRLATLYEHRECVRFGAEPTACPSDRVPWADIFAELAIEEDDMKIELVWCAEETKVYLIGPQGARWLKDAKPGVAPFDELQREYGPMERTLTRAALNAIGVVP